MWMPSCCVRLEDVLCLCKPHRFASVSLFMVLLRLLLLIGMTAPLVQAETHVFVSQAGTLLEAEIIAVSGDSVTLKRRSDDQSIIVNRKTLCKEDSVYIAHWQEQHADSTTKPTAATEGAAVTAAKYRLVCQTLPSKSNRGPASSDQRTFELTYNFNISNQEVRRDLEHARGVVLTLGKNAAETNGDLIVLQKEEFDVSIRAQSKMAHVTQPVRLTYNQDPDYAYGVKSHGYILIIRDAAGNLLLVESSPDTSAKYTKEILSLSTVPCMVDRDFRLKPKAEVPFGYISF
jgi:hypothetical protein